VTRWCCTAAIPIRRLLRENDLAHPVIEEKRHES